MKILVFLTTLLFGCVSYAEVAKICKASFSFEGKLIEFDSKVFNNNGQLSGEIVNTTMGIPQKFEYETVNFFDESVRKDLSPFDVNTDDLNMAEGLIVHAMSISELGMSAGFDLTLVRSAKVWQFFERGTNIGTTAIIEARAENGELLGSFFGGFFVSPCE